MKKIYTTILLTLFITSVSFSQMASFSIPGVYTSTCGEQYVEVQNMSEPIIGADTVYAYFINGVFVKETTTLQVDSFLLPPGNHHIRLEVFDKVTPAIISEYEGNVSVAGVRIEQIPKDGKVCPGTEAYIKVSTNEMYGNFSYSFIDNGTDFGMMGNEFTINNFSGSHNVEIRFDGEISPCATSSYNVNFIEDNTAAPPTEIIGNGMEGDKIEMLNICANTNNDFTAKYPSSSTKEWSRDGTNYSSQEWYTFYEMTLGSYELILKQDNGCAIAYDTIQLEVTTDAIPQYNYDYDYFKQCDSIRYDFNGIGLSSDLTFNWDIRGMKFIDQTNPSILLDRNESTIFCYVEVVGSCGTDTSFFEINPMMINFDNNTPSDSITIVDYDNNDNCDGDCFIDNYTTCPNNKLEFKLYNSNHDGNYKYMVKIDTMGMPLDSFEIYSEYFYYSFPKTGDYSIYLNLFDINCNTPISPPMATIINVNVRTGQDMLKADLNRFPESPICPGGMVAFWDESNGYGKTYSLNFGDGTYYNNTVPVKGEDEPDFMHIYTEPGTYFVSYSVTDTNCLATKTLSGNIYVGDGFETKNQFFVLNSTMENENPSEAKGVEDWSQPPAIGNYKEISVPIDWSMYTNNLNLDSTFIIIAFYSDDEYGEMPSGSSYSITKPGVGQDTVTIYVPNDFTTDTVNLMFAWYSDGYSKLNALKSGTISEEPTIMYPMPISVDITNNTPDTTMTIYISEDPNAVSNPNSPNNLKGDWIFGSKKNKNEIKLYIKYDEMMMQYGFEMNYYDSAANQSKYANGSLVFDTINKKITFYVENNYDTCSMTNTTLYYNATYDSIIFNGDPGTCTMGCCGSIISLLSGKTLTKEQWIPYQKVCPGTEVEFRAYGAESVTWKFPDGSTKVGEFVKYSNFTTPGENIVKALVTNLCGTVDTIESKVYITEDEAPIVSGLNYNQVMENIYSFNINMNDSDGDNFNKYAWIINSTDTILGNNAIYTFNSTGNFNVEAIATNGCGTDKSTININIPSVPSTCGALPVNFSFIQAPNSTDWDEYIFKAEVDTVGKDYSYTWDFGNNANYGYSTYFHFNDDGYYNVCLTVKDNSSGCISKACKNNIYFGDPQCESDFSFNITGTSNNIVEFFDNTPINATAWNWNFGNGATSTQKNPVYQYSKNGLYNVCLSVFDNNAGVVCSTCKEIMIGDQSNVCEATIGTLVNGDTITFSSATFGTGPFNYFWDFGDNSYSQLRNPKHNYSVSGDYTVTLSVQSQTTGCQATTEDIVTVGNSDCNADFNYSQIPGTSKIIVTNTSTGDIGGLYFQFDNGEYSTSNKDTIDFLTPGIYQACLSIIGDTTSCQSSICKEIAISEDTAGISIADFAFMVDTSSNLKINFKDNSSFVASDVYWVFGDGTTGQGSAVSRTYTKAGVYNVCMTALDASDPMNIKSIQKCKEVNAGFDQITCQIKSSFTYFVDPVTKSIKFSNKSTGNVTQSFWNFGDNTTSSKMSPSKVYSKEGFYLVSLSVNDSIGKCSDYSSQFIQVGAADCRAEFEFALTQNANEIVFTNKSQNASNYFWDFGDGFISTIKDPKHNYGKAGMYGVGLTISDASGTCADYLGAQVQVGSVDCNADFEYYVDSSNNTVNFTSKTMGDISNYYWIFGDGTISTEANPVHNFKYPGFFKVALNTFDQVTGCMDHDEQMLLVGSEGIDCEADFMYIIDEVTRDVEFFNLSSGTDLTYKWNFGELVPNSTVNATSTDINPVYQFTRDGFFNVCLLAQTPSGVQNLTCKNLKISSTGAESCYADFVFSIDNKTVNFSDKSIADNITTYKWSFDDGSTSADANPVKTYSIDSTYRIKLEIETATGCKSNKVSLISIGDSSGLQTAFYSKQQQNGLKVSGYPVDFVGLSHGDAARMRWDFGDGETDTTTTTPTHYYTQEGTYYVCVEVEDPIIPGAYDTYCDSVLVKAGDGIDYSEKESVVLRLFPNPTKEYTNIVYVLPSAAEVSIEVYNSKGELVDNVINTMKPQGLNNFKYNVNNLPSGVYYVKLNANNETTISKLIVQ